MQTIKLTLFMVLGLSIAFCTKGTDVVPDPSDMDNDDVNRTEMAPEVAKLNGEFTTDGGNTAVPFTYKQMEKWNTIFELTTNIPNDPGTNSLHYIGTDNPELKGIQFGTAIYDPEGNNILHDNNGTFQDGPAEPGAFIYLNYPQTQGHINYVQVTFTGKDGKDYFVNLPLFRITKKSKIFYQ